MSGRKREYESDSQLGAIGIDVGGTKIAVVLISAHSGRIIYRTRAATHSEAGVHVLLETIGSLALAARDEAAKKGVEVVGIGLAVPEVVDTNGRITTGDVIPGFERVELSGEAGWLGEVVVEADVRAGALAEANFGAGAGHANFCFVTVGTGISFSFVLDGVPWRGERGAALVLGSGATAFYMDESGVERRWVLEDIASGPALLARYRDMGGAAQSTEEVLSRAGSDALAARVCSEGGRALGVSVGMLANLLDPAAIVVGGGLGTASGAYWDAAMLTARSNIWAPDVRDLPILQAKLGSDAVAVGAALLPLRTRGGVDGLPSFSGESG